MTGLVRGDLDWISMKALEKDRSRRYQSAQDLAIDLQHYLDDQPVSAGPPTIRYRLSRLIRRNRLAVFAGTLILLSSAGGVLGLAWGYLQAAKENQLKTEAIEGQQQAIAGQRQAIAGQQKAIEELEAANLRTLQGLRTLTDQWIVRTLARDWELSVEDRQFLTEIQERYEEFAQTKGTSKGSRAVRAEGLTRQGLMIQLLGDPDAAREKFQEAQQVWQSLAQDDPEEPTWKLELANIYRRLADEDLTAGRPDAAIEGFRQALGLAQGIEAQAAELEYYGAARSDLHQGLAMALRVSEDHEQSLIELSRATEICQKYLTEKPGDFDLALRLSTVENSKAAALLALGRTDEAMQTYQQALTRLQRLVTENPGRPNPKLDLAMALGNLGAVCWENKQIPEGQKFYDQSIRELEELVDQFPGIAKFHYYHAFYLWGRSNAEANRAQWTDSLVDLQAAEKILQRWSNKTSHEPKYAVLSADVQLGLARAFDNGLAMREEAVQAMQAALETFDQLRIELPDNPSYLSRLASAENSLGLLLQKMNRLDEAEPHLQRAADLRQQLANRHPDNVYYALDLGGSYCNLGNFLMARNKLETAVPRFDQAIEVLHSVLVRSPQLASAQKFLRNSYFGRMLTHTKLGNHQQVVDDAEAALEYDDGSQNLLISLNRLNSLVRLDANLAVADAEALLEQQGDKPTVQYQLARVFALAAAQQAAGLKTDELAQRSLELLKKFRDAGGFPGEAEKNKLQQEPDFKSLQESLPWQEFVESLK